MLFPKNDAFLPPTNFKTFLMKPSFFLLLFTTIILFSCSDDNANENPDGNTDTDGDVIEMRDYVDAIVSTPSNGSPQELRFIYDSNNNLVRNETNTYFRQYTYSGNNITKIESITLPDTPYYTVDFIYDDQGRVAEVKRNNHHNGTYIMSLMNMILVIE